MCPNKYDHKKKKKLINYITGLNDDKEHFEVISIYCTDDHFVDSRKVKVDIRRLACDFAPTSRIKREDSLGKYEIIFAFSTKNVERFLSIYTTTLLVTPDKTGTRIHYTKSILSRTIGDRPRHLSYHKPKFSASCYPFSNNMILLDEAYRVENQREILKSTLSCYGISKCANCNFKQDYGIFNRGHLNPVNTMQDVYEQQSTYYYLNTAPQWKTINKGNWKKSEEFAREMAVHFDVDIELYTGTHDQLTLVDTCNGEEKKIYLFGEHKGESVTIPVPLYFYKILYARKLNKAVVMVTVNNPYLSLTERSKYHLCKYFKINTWAYKDRHVKMPKWATKDESAGYSYMCELFDFLSISKINIEGLASSKATSLIWT